MKNFIYILALLFLLTSCVFNIPTVCVPGCGPGQVCSHGTCVSLCNPGCGPSEVCTGEGLCVPSSSTTDSSVPQTDASVSQPDVIQPVQWTQTYAHSLDSYPQGLQLLTGPRDVQSFASIGGRNCLMQSSNWNFAFIPVPRPAHTRYEAIEVSVYVMSQGSNFRFYGYGDLLGSNYVNNSLSLDITYPAYSLIGGNTMAGATTIESNLLAFPLNRWVHLRMEIDKTDNLMTVQVDQSLLYRQDIPVAYQAWYSGGSVVLYSGGGVCWSMLGTYTRN